MAHKVKAWWIRYNPLTQKPTSLHPYLGWNWLSYYGPDPTSGVSYGSYVDEESRTIVLSEKKPAVFSPVTGKPMAYICEVSGEELAHKAKAKVTEADYSCTSCGFKASVATSGLSPGYCVSCGDGSAQQPNTKGHIMASKLEEIKAKLQTKKASNAAYAKIVAKAKKKALASEDKEDLDDILADKDAKASEEWVPLEEIIQEAKSKMDCSAEGEEASEPEVEMASEEAPSEEDEFVDLDVVLSSAQELAKEKVSARKKVKAAIARQRRMAVVKARVRARMKATASDDTPFIDVAVPEAELAGQAPKPVVVSEDPLNPGMPDFEHEPSLDPAAVKGPSELGAEPAPELAAEKEEMTAMKFEPLASLRALASAKRDDIDMVLFDDQGANPTWNVSVAGTPACRVSLQDQDYADEIRSVFCSEDYARDLLEHCVKAGFIPTMNRVKAKFWANEFTKSDALKDITQKATASLEAEKSKYLAAYKESFLGCMNIVSAGMNKNFYPEGNALKMHLFSQLTNVGLPEQTAISVIEASFSEAAPSYFKTLFEKSTDYMALTKEARGEIAQAIMRSPVLQENGSSELEPVTLADRVATASVLPSLTSTGPGFTVRAATSINSDEYKHQLARSWRPKLG